MRFAASYGPRQISSLVEETTAALISALDPLDDLRQAAGLFKGAGKSPIAARSPEPPAQDPWRTEDLESGMESLKHVAFIGIHAPCFISLL